MKKVLVTMLTSLILTGCGGYSSGEKVGSIVRISRDGIIFKTNEAELIRGGLNNGSGVMGKPFYFTIKDKSLLAVANKAMDENKEIKLTYHSEYIAPLSSTNDDNNFADAITIIN